MTRRRAGLASEPSAQSVVERCGRLYLFFSPSASRHAGCERKAIGKIGNVLPRPRPCPGRDFAARDRSASLQFTWARGPRDDAPASVSAAFEGAKKKAQLRRTSHRRSRSKMSVRVASGMRRGFASVHAQAEAFLAPQSRAFYQLDFKRDVRVVVLNRDRNRAAAVA